MMQDVQKKKKNVTRISSIQKECFDTYVPIKITFTVSVNSEKSNILLFLKLKGQQLLRLKTNSNL